MSMNLSEASEKASDARPTGSVYDFLYCDQRRIGAFLSQFDELGIPTRVSVSESLSKARSNNWNFGIGFGASLPLLGGGNANVNAGQGSSEAGGTKSEQRDYDPYWANALAFLDYLESNDLICRDIDGARFGQLVLLKGNLGIIDLRLFTKMWEKPQLRSLLKSGLGLPANDGKKSYKSKPEAKISTAQLNEFDIIMDLIGEMPHAIQSRLIVQESENKVWSTLSEDAIVGSAADLFLKHGTAIVGEWAVLGILDARPEQNLNGSETPDGRQANEASRHFADTPFAEILGRIEPFVRPMLGRPYQDYGLTPLIIFRRVESTITEAQIST